MKYLCFVLPIVLTGCASGCQSHCLFGFFGPGNAAFDAVGNYYNTQDPCQHIGKEPGYKLADFCFANAGKKVYHVRDINGKLIYKVTQ